MNKTQDESWIEIWKANWWIYTVVTGASLGVIAYIVLRVIFPSDPIPEFTTDTFNSFTTDKCYELIKQYSTVVGVNKIEC